MGVKSRRTLVLVAASGIAVGALVAANGVGSESDSESLANGPEALASVMTDPPNVSVYRPYSRVSEFLPNVRHSQRGYEQSSTATDSVVVGRVSAYERDRGFVELGQPGTAGRAGARATEFDDPDADWRTMKLTIAVDEVISGPRSGQTFLLYFPMLGSTASGEDPDVVGKALQDLGRIIVFSDSYPNSPEFLGINRALPDKLYGVATVNEDGHITFPFADAAEGCCRSRRLTTSASLSVETC
jgi:hypothetical protein